MGEPSLDVLFLQYMGVLPPGLSGSDLLVSILGDYHLGCFISYSLKKCGHENDISFLFQEQTR